MPRGVKKQVQEGVAVEQSPAPSNPTPSAVREGKRNDLDNNGYPHEGRVRTIQ